VKDSSCEILATYEDYQLPAAVLCRVGQGTAFLCGLHPEFEWGVVNCPLADELRPQEPFRKKIWELIKSKLKLSASEEPLSSRRCCYITRLIDVIHAFVSALWEMIRKVSFLYIFTSTR
jgi:hypothetical protein